MTHLDVLQLRLSNERARLSTAKTAGEQVLRAAWVAQIEREIAGELDFLGLPAAAPVGIDDDELFNELFN